MAILNITKPYLSKEVKIYRDNAPLWTYSLDWKSPKGLQIAFRTLLNACIKLPNTSKSNFLLKDIFQSQRNILIGNQRKELAHNALLDFLFLQLAQEEFIKSDTCFLLYPSHSPSKGNKKLEESIQQISYKFGSNYTDNSLIRWKMTQNKSLLRTNNERHKISFENEFNSLCLNIKKKIRDKTVIVIDDFTTTGLSLDSAKNLLEKAEIDKLVLCSIGKYTRPYATYSRYDIQKEFNPYTQEDKITSKDFIQRKMNITVNLRSQNSIVEYFQRLSMK